MSLLAVVDGERITATPRGRARCPQCEGEMIAHCGRLVSWHWAHVAKDCDPWSEPESEWHLSTKLRFQLAGCSIEQRIAGPDRWHVADVVTPGGVVIELQHSALSAAEIAEREQFYGEMLWLWDAERWIERIHHGRYGFWWKHGARSQATCHKRVIWDLGGDPFYDSFWHVRLSDVARRDWLGQQDGADVWSSTEHHRVLGKKIHEYTTLTELLATLPPAFDAPHQFSLELR